MQKFRTPNIVYATAEVMMVATVLERIRQNDDRFALKVHSSTMSTILI